MWVIMIRQTWILDSTLWIPDFLSVELGFQTPIEGRIWDSFSCITGSNPRILVGLCTNIFF